MSSSQRLRIVSPRVFATVFYLAACAATAHGAAGELLAINTPRSGEHHVGKVVWEDLATPDLAGAEKFYGGLFGWTFRTIHTGSSDYAMALLGGRPIAGLMQKPIALGEHQQPAWLTFIAASDVDAVTQKALAHGAKVLAAAKTYPGRGRQTVLSDPEGAVFAVLASSSGDSPDYLAEPGEWIWSSVHAKDAGTEAAFYQEIFGYDVFDASSGDGLEHLILSSDDSARASANTFPVDSVRRHSHWINYVRVDNAAAAVAKATAMGGRVLVEPHTDRHGGMVAVIADPAGAPVGLMEWTDTDTKVEPK